MKIDGLWSSLGLILICASTTGFYGCFNENVDRPSASKQANNWFVRSQAADDLTHFVDTRSATGGLVWTSGHVSPAAMRPFGMVRLGPDTSTLEMVSSSSGYFYGDLEVLGFSHTRFVGTGIKEGGVLRVLPTNSTPDILKLKNHILPMNHTHEIARPGYYLYENEKRGLKVELTAGRRTGVHRYHFAKSNEPHLLVDLTSTLSNSQFTDRQKIATGVRNLKVQVDKQKNRITGSFTLFGGASERVGGAPIYFVMQTSVPFEHRFIDGYGQVFNYLSLTRKDGKTYLDLKFDQADILLAVALSYTDQDRALHNLNSEFLSIADRPFERIAEEARADWNRRLRKIEISATDKAAHKFYNNLYRTMTMPTVYSDSAQDSDSVLQSMSDLDLNSLQKPSGTVMTYKGFDKKKRLAVGHEFYSDLSLWDTFRTVHPLYNLIAKQEHLSIIRSLIDMSRESGRLPRWAGPLGHTDSMLGLPSSIVITEAILKNIGLNANEINEAYASMKVQASGAEVNANNQKLGTDCLKETIAIGYCPAEVKGSVSYTLEYAYADHAHALLAEKVGDLPAAAEFRRRSKFFMNLWNPSYQAFVPRYRSGRFETDFRLDDSFYLGQTKAKHGYFEGSPNQWRWYVPHDIASLISLFGGAQKFTSELTRFFADSKPEIGAADPGALYWHGNEPDIHAAYLFALAGHPELTQKWVRWVEEHKYAVGSRSIDGEDDAGTLSAWYVLSSLGFYPIAGTTQYIVGSPFFERATVDLGNNQFLKIEAPGAASGAIYVQSVRINGKALSDPWFDHSQIADGGTIEFVMSTSPTNWRFNP